MGLPLARLVAVCLVLALAKGSELQTGKELGDQGQGAGRIRGGVGGGARQSRAVQKGLPE